MAAIVVVVACASLPGCGGGQLEIDSAVVPPCAKGSDQQDSGTPDVVTSCFHQDATLVADPSTLVLSASLGSGCSMGVIYSELLITMTPDSALSVAEATTQHGANPKYELTFDIEDLSVLDILDADECLAYPATINVWADSDEKYCMQFELCGDITDGEAISEGIDYSCNSQP